MADFCSLCGTKLSFFGGHFLTCANQDEIFCSQCHDNLYPMNNAERGRYVLENGKPAHAKKMQEFMDEWDAKNRAREEVAEQRKVLEPSQRPCPNCGTMMDRKLQDFRIGADGDNDLFDLLLRPQYNVDLYACPECGKVELYTANFAALKRKQEEQAAEKASAETQSSEKPTEREYTSYRPGRKNEKPPWEQ